MGMAWKSHPLFFVPILHEVDCLNDISDFINDRFRQYDNVFIVVENEYGRLLHIPLGKSIVRRKYRPIVFCLIDYLSGVRAFIWVPQCYPRVK